MKTVNNNNIEKRLKPYEHIWLSREVGGTAFYPNEPICILCGAIYKQAKNFPCEYKIEKK
jgi:hypothetical protein